MDADGCELLRYLDFLIELEGKTGCLFTVAKRRVENSYLFVRMAIDKEDNSPQGLFLLSYQIICRSA
jgi:hypothetical protein